MPRRRITACASGAPPRGENRTAVRTIPIPIRLPPRERPCRCAVRDCPVSSHSLALLCMGNASHRSVAQRSMASQCTRALVLLWMLKTVDSANGRTSAVNEGATASSLDCPSSLHGQHFGVCRCRCTLVDVGLNNGHSLRLWPKDALARGARSDTRPVWQRLRECNATSTCYYGFEANPMYDHTLQGLESHHQKIHDGTRIKIFTSTAFTTHGDGVDFFVAPSKLGTGHRKLIRNGHAPGMHPGPHASNFGYACRSLVHAETSTLEPTMPAVTKGKHGWSIHLSSSAVNDYNLTHVASVNASQFLAAIIDWSDFVGVKMDVEGYEYSLLPHLLRSTPAALCGLDLLAIEWHGYARNASRLGPTIKRQLDSCNLTIIDWH